MTSEPCLHFVPSRVDGLPNVTEVAVHPDRLELHSADSWIAIRFDAIARWPRPTALRRLLGRIGWRPRWLPVGERDWFHPPSERFFRFFSTPPLVIYLPDEDGETAYSTTLFRQVQEVIRLGGFDTYDLG
jgi:hypothetical protein